MNREWQGGFGTAVGERSSSGRRTMVEGAKCSDQLQVETASERRRSSAKGGAAVRGVVSRSGRVFFFLSLCAHGLHESLLQRVVEGVDPTSSQWDSVLVKKVLTRICWAAIKVL